MTTPNHVIDFEFDPRWGLRAQARCQETDSWCRTAPPKGCECESFNPEKDDDGWFHLAYVPAEVNPDEEEVHRHTPSDECTIALFMNEDEDLLDGSPKGEPFKLGTIPIEFEWNEGWYAWWAKPAEPETGDPS